MKRQKKNKIKIKIQDSLTKRNVTEHLTYKRNHEIKLRILQRIATCLRITCTVICSIIRACDKGEGNEVFCRSLNIPKICTMIPSGIPNPEEILYGNKYS